MYINADKFAKRSNIPFRVIHFIDYIANGLEEALINRNRHSFS